MISGLGIDILNLKRPELYDIEFAKRFMTNQELVELNKCTTVKQKRHYLASIWSLKEAIIKATNHQFVFSKIEVKLTNEAPVCYLEGVRLFLSISYEKENLVAIAIAFPSNVNELE